MTTIDYAARLALVQAAITAILTGKMESYEIEGQKVTYLDLADLQAQEQRLVAMVNRASGQRSAFRRGVMS
jgi:predicted aldo/keto reductase-like oxidoreductase